MIKWFKTKKVIYEISHKDLIDALILMKVIEIREILKEGNNEKI